MIATVFSPFLAAGLTALFTLHWQDRKEKRDAKLKIFSSLMSVRGNITNFSAAQEWIRSLQLIDVIFADAPNVIEKWRELYPMLQHSDVQPGQGHKMIELHSAMAANLGLRLQQVDIDKSHFPKAIADPIARANGIQEELLRVLKKTDSIIVQPLPASRMAPPPLPVVGG